MNRPQNPDTRGSPAVSGLSDRVLLGVVIVVGLMAELLLLGYQVPGARGFTGIERWLRAGLGRWSTFTARLARYKWLVSVKNFALYALGVVYVLFFVDGTRITDYLLRGVARLRSMLRSTLN